MRPVQAHFIVCATICFASACGGEAVISADQAPSDRASRDEGDDTEELLSPPGVACPPTMLDGVESFEGLGSGILDAPFTFASCLTLTMVGPHPSNNAHVVDCAGDGAFGDASCAELRPTFPDGVAGFGLDMQSFEVELALPHPALYIEWSSVGVEDHGSYEVTALDENRQWLSSNKGGGGSLTWRTSGMGTTEAMHYLTIRGYSGGAFIFDSVRWYSEPMY